MRAVITSAASVALWSCSGCGPAAPERAPPAALVDTFELAPVATADRVATLAWQPPRGCTQVFRVRVDEGYPPGLEDMLRTRAEHSDSYLAVTGPEGAGEAWPAGPVPEDRVFTGRTLFRGPKTQGRPLQREFALSAGLAGPASPDAACFERTWDPVEDALALGWV